MFTTKPVLLDEFGNRVTCLLLVQTIF